MYKRQREDLAQVAAYGILKALDRYTPDRGGTFESYAVPTAVGEIKRHFRDHSWGSKVSRCLLYTSRCV